MGTNKTDTMLILDWKDKKPMYMFSQSDLLALVQRVLIIAASWAHALWHTTCDDTDISERLLISCPRWRKFVPRIWWASGRSFILRCVHLKTRLPAMTHFFPSLLPWFLSFFPLFSPPLVRLFCVLGLQDSSRHLQWSDLRGWWLSLAHQPIPPETVARHNLHGNDKSMHARRYTTNTVEWNCADDLQPILGLPHKNQLQLWSQCSSHLPQDGMRMLSPDFKCIKWKIGYQTRLA